MKKRLIYLLWILMVPFLAWPQAAAPEPSNLTKKQRRRARPAYIRAGLIMGQARLRDFATSPLMYTGSNAGLGLASLKKEDARETELGFQFTGTSYTASVGDHTSSSSGAIYTCYYASLYQLPSLSNDKWNTKVGGKLELMGDFRINESLMNNALGIELFPTVFASGKTTFKWENKAKERKFLFLKHQTKARKRELSYQLNVGVLNSSLRNGYIYNSQEALVNGEDLFANHEFKMFNNFRASSSLDYTVYLSNKNAFQVSYLWDVIQTGGSLDKFEFASHSLRFSLLFNLR